MHRQIVSYLRTCLDQDSHRDCSYSSSKGIPFLQVEMTIEQIQTDEACGCASSRSPVTPFTLPTQPSARCPPAPVMP
ncbi:MAG: hypothetical protein Ct9H300mP32_6470 [Verrucomicrobiota bacterium]|nr:MAG: hypothetical protein Ct9H300mP32_6470 [Verrucomicrobiota bacterium]